MTLKKNLKCFKIVSARLLINWSAVLSSEVIYVLGLLAWFSSCQSIKSFTNVSTLPWASSTGRTINVWCSSWRKSLIQSLDTSTLREIFQKYSHFAIFSFQPHIMLSSALLKLMVLCCRYFGPFRLFSDVQLNCGNGIYQQKEIHYKYVAIL